MQTLLGGDMDPEIDEENRSRLFDFCTEKNAYPVFEKERDFIKKRREAMGGEGQAEPLDPRPTTRNNLVGLCLSGGGIRSATFNLGFMQALYKQKILQRVDYLSTVSGGGYIGSCLTALLSSGSKINTEQKEQQEEQKKKESGQKKPCKLHVSEDKMQTGRDASADDQKGPFLWRDDVFPFANAFSADAENRLIKSDASPLDIDDLTERAPLRRLRYYSNYLTTEGNLFQKYLGPVLAFVRGLIFNLMTIIPLIILMSSLLAAIYTAIPRWDSGWADRAYSTMPGLKQALKKQKNLHKDYENYAFLQTEHLGRLADMSDRIEWVEDNPRHKGELERRKVGIESADTEVRSHWWAMLVIPAIGLGLMMAVYSLLFIRDLWSKKEYALRSRFLLSMGFSSFMFACLCVWAIQAFGAAIVYWQHFELYKYDNLPFVSLLTFLGPMLLKKATTPTAQGRKPWVKIIISIILMALTPLVLLCFTGFCVVYLMQGPVVLSPFLERVPLIGAVDPLYIDMAGALLIGLMLFIVTNNQYNINKFSLHNFYRDRLSRAYIIQAVDGDFGSQGPFEQVVPNDRIKLSELYADAGPITGPYHIINANLNLKKESLTLNKGDALFGKGVSSLVSRYRHRFEKTGDVPTAAYEEADSHIFRKGESFIFSKCWCGSQKTGYVPTTDYEGEDSHINLGTAMAVSGAAVNIGMGQGDKPALRLLMGLLNIRLGYWAHNPKQFEKGAPKRWFKKAPGSWEGLCEWIGQYTLNGKYVNLSDGGHFDNIGVYEMLRRRCKYIIVGDAEADGDMTFQALANLIRLAFIDFGIIIDMDISGLKRDADKKLSGQHCAMGTIKYPNCGTLDEEMGYLFYCKSSLTGDEPAHLYEYQVNYPDFPHQSTADQWFDERQFEVYRELGFHVGYWSFHSAADIKENFNMEGLFVKLKQYWQPRTAASKERLIAYAAELKQIYARIRGDEHLAFMDTQIYPEWEELMAGAKKPPRVIMWLPDGAEQRRAGFYICNQMLQLMESVYMGLDLDEQFDHPDNRGWMNLFRHWSWAGIFRVAWAISACTYGAKFQSFCKRRLNLDTGKVSAENWGQKYKNYKTHKGDSATDIDPWALNYTQLMVVMSKYGNPYELIKAKDQIPPPKEKDQIPDPEENTQQLDPADLQLCRRGCYGFNLEVKNPLDEKKIIGFSFGFAYTIVSDDHICVDYLRIQDHLRRMGLGRLALVRLVEMIIEERVDGKRDKKENRNSAKIEVLDRIDVVQSEDDKRSVAEIRVMNMLASVKTEIRHRLLSP